MFKADFALCDAISSCVIYEIEAGVFLFSKRYHNPKELFCVKIQTLKRQIHFSYMIAYDPSGAVLTGTLIRGDRILPPEIGSRDP